MARPRSQAVEPSRATAGADEVRAERLTSQGHAIAAGQAGVVGAITSSLARAACISSPPQTKLPIAATDKHVIRS